MLHLDTPGDPLLGFAAAVARGLESYPRHLDARWLYDAHGSEIYEQITELPEYYPTRTEDGILARCAPKLAELVGDVTVVELGSGSSTKTRHVLDAFTARASAAAPPRYVPIDISPTAVELACRDLVARYPSLQVEGVVSTYERGIDLIAPLSPVLLLFLGSSIGNLVPDEMQAFFGRIARAMSPGDHFLLGVDLVKDVEVLEPAYADSQGLTEAFILNTFGRMTRELGAELPLDALEMVSFYNGQLDRIEMYTRFREPCTLHLEPLRRSFRIARGEMVLTEISRKFHLEQVAADAARFDLVLREAFTDESGWFGVLLLERVGASSSRLPDWPGRLRTLHERLRELQAAAPDAVSDAAPADDDLQGLATRQERLVEAVQASGRLWEPPFVELAPPRPDAAPVGEWRFVPEGAVRLGEDEPVDVPAFHIGAVPVTNGEYLRFLEDGGYERRELWSEEGWAWRAREGVEAPAHWVARDRRWCARWFGRVVPLDPLRPVAMVSAWEAEAFARWADARLPTELEWEKAAAWDPGLAQVRTWPWGETAPDARRANLGQRLLESAAVGSYTTSRSFYGCQQQLGDVWEWTAGSGPVRAARGGSFATPSLVVRCGVRRELEPGARHAFTGFRLGR